MYTTSGGTPRRRRQDNIKIDFKHLVCSSMQGFCEHGCDISSSLKVRFCDEMEHCQLRNTHSHGMSYILSRIGVTVDGVWIRYWIY
jgi:hypothetical protein